MTGTTLSKEEDTEQGNASQENCPPSVTYPGRWEVTFRTGTAGIQESCPATGRKVSINFSDSSSTANMYSATPSFMADLKADRGPCAVRKPVKVWDLDIHVSQEWVQMFPQL